jgi:hypothetical protein
MWQQGYMKLIKTLYFLEILWIYYIDYARDSCCSVVANAAVFRWVGYRLSEGHNNVTDDKEGAVKFYDYYISVV